jgi:hypothetical protein
MFYDMSSRHCVPDFVGQRIRFESPQPQIIGERALRQRRAARGGAARRALDQIAVVEHLGSGAFCANP